MNSQEYNLKISRSFEKVPEFKAPDWIELLKSSPSKERPIEEPDFWHKKQQVFLDKFTK